MKRIKFARVLASLAVLTVTLSFNAQAQNRAINGRATKQTSAQNTTRAYSPRIAGRSNSMILEGRITEIRDNIVSIKTVRGLRYDFAIDDQTTTLNSDELISIATMSDITLSVSDLRAGDQIEIVAERVGRQAAARIITRVARSSDHIARR